MRRRRDRLLRRKGRLSSALIRHGFFPASEPERKALTALDPYELRASGLDRPLLPGEFARALFHINQRRGFKSNRRTDKQDNTRSALKSAIEKSRNSIVEDGCRTVGEWLARRHAQRLPVRSRYHEKRALREDGRPKIDKYYDLYIDREMVEREFDALWSAQAGFDPKRYREAARAELKDILLFQRKLRPTKPGRCTFLQDLERAPLALPTVQRFRIYQELNNLRLVDEHLGEHALTSAQRDAIAAELEERSEITFKGIARRLKLGGDVRFNLEDEKRDKLKGNATSALLAKDYFFGASWRTFSEEMQDVIVQRLVTEENGSALVSWLVTETGVDESCAERIANAVLADGYGNVSIDAARRILQQLRIAVVSYADAVQKAGFDHHSALSHFQQTGELMLDLPYYGGLLQRHVGFGTGVLTDPDEVRYGRIANPTVHVGLNQVRRVVNGLIARYGAPTEVVIEVARELKQGRERRMEIQREQAERQKQNQLWADDYRAMTGHAPTAADLQKFRLWRDLNPKDATDRRCPYTGEQISLQRLFSADVEVEHILPFSRTLDDSLNNKTVAMRRANRDKGDRTPWEAFGEGRTSGYDYDSMLARASAMPRDKAIRFAPDGYERWLRDEKDFLARALNDTAYLSRIAREYLSLVCPHNKVRVIPGRLTALLRGKFGLNDVLGKTGEKNRNDHRHHAVDAAVIGVTDQGLLQRVAKASASARAMHLDRLVDSMPVPWPTYRAHVERAVNAIVVSHRPDHNHEGRLHNDTAYGLRDDGKVSYRKMVDGTRTRVLETLNVIPMTASKAAGRHGRLADGSPKPYKGYKGDSNYGIEISTGEHGRWEGRVVSTFEANQVARTRGIAALRDPITTLDGKPLLMRLMTSDCVRFEIDGRAAIMRVAQIRRAGNVTFAEHFEANVDARNRDQDDQFVYVTKSAGSLKAARACLVSVSPIGEVRVGWRRDF
jgi:CRISPR-associated endonuclease Csn1